MTRRIPGRPDLVGTTPQQLQTTRPRVLQSEDAATVDAQRVTQQIAQRTNLAIDRVNQIIETPFGEGQMLTQPVGNGQRTELLTLAAGANVIPHTLGRPAQGFAIVDLHGTLGASGGSPQYAQFYTDQTQIAPAVYTNTNITWTTKPFGTAGITCPGTPGTPSAAITIANAGIYSVRLRVSANQTLGGVMTLALQCELNGALVLGTVAPYQIPSNASPNDHTVYVGWFISVAAGDVLRLKFNVSNVNLVFYSAGRAGNTMRAAVVDINNMDFGGAGAIDLVHVDRSRGEDERSIRIDASTACQAKLWVW